MTGGDRRRGESLLTDAGMADDRRRGGRPRDGRRRRGQGGAAAGTRGRGAACVAGPATGTRRGSRSTDDRAGRGGRRGTAARPRRRRRHRRPDQGEPRLSIVRHGLRRGLVQPAPAGVPPGVRADDAREEGVCRHAPAVTQRPRDHVGVGRGIGRRDAVPGRGDGWSLRSGRRLLGDPAEPVGDLGCRRQHRCLHLVVSDAHAPGVGRTGAADRPVLLLAGRRRPAGRLQQTADVDR